MIATLTSKGQLTIPKPIRDHLRLHAGDKLEFFMDDDGLVRIAPVTYPLARLKGMVPKPKKAVTLEDMDTAIAIEGGSS